MTGRTLARAYLRALERGDLDEILALFHPDAVVHSPLYGRRPPRSSIRGCSPTPARRSCTCAEPPRASASSASGSASTGRCRRAPRPASNASTCSNSTATA
ncbi:nuclear transport factor 2 family protein [Actinomadura madurae]|uniref:nuclear transport factor 2 family protein n=1 Tax=Actinomadura madurae TaxID=1993 RepID=UPI003556B679